MTDYKAKIIKCTKYDIRWGSAPDPVGELTRLPRPSSCIKGRLFLRGGRGRERGREGGRKGKEKGNVKGKMGGDGKGLPDQCQAASYAPGKCFRPVMPEPLSNVCGCAVTTQKKERVSAIPCSGSSDNRNDKMVCYTRRALNVPVTKI